MTTSYTGLLGLALPETGDLSGQWGNVVNSYITQYLDAAVAGAQTISGNQTAVTLSKTEGTALTSAGSGATGSSQYAIINCTGNPPSTLVIDAPKTSKAYLVLNNTSTNQSVTVRGGPATPTTGVTVAAARCALIAWNGSDFEVVATTDAASLSGTLAVVNGGTGVSSLTANNVILGNGTSAVQFVAPGTTGNVLTSNGTTWTSAAPAATLSGVTDSLSPYETALGYEAGLNNTGDYNVFVGYRAGKFNTSGYDNAFFGGFAGTSCTTGLANTAVGGNAQVGTTGYLNSVVGWNALSASTTAYESAALGGRAGQQITTGYQNTMLGYAAMQNTDTGNRNTAVGHSAGQNVSSGTQNVFLGALAGASGTNDITTGSNNIIIGYNAAASSATVSNEVTIGNTSITSTRLRGVVELNAAMFEAASVSATAATGTINFDVRTRSVMYYTTNASGNWTLNVRAASGVSLDSIMTTGESVTIAFLVTNGGTAYYQTGFQVDGSSITPKWQGGTAPTAGNTNSIDVYVITIIKTGAATFTALASQTKFA